jgi:hypothetical protein
LQNTYTKMPSMLCKNRVLNTSLFSVKTCTRRHYMYQYATRIQTIPNAFYALQKSRFEYESVLSEDVYA